MKNIWHRVERWLGIYRWHPKIALRYLPVVSELNTKYPHCEVLEVGSNGLGIAPYLRRNVIGADLNFAPPFHQQLTPIKADATNLPFANNSFDAVISLDMLEHINPVKRLRVIEEMTRIASRFVCIGVPSGALAEAQDNELKTEYRKKYDKEFHYLEEQVEYGLPEKEEIVQMIKKSAIKYHKNISIRTESNINLKLRKWLMRGWMSENMLSNIFNRKLLLLVVPLFQTMNHEPAYRQLFFVEIHNV